MRLDKDQLKVLAVLIVVGGAFGVGIWWPAHQQRRALQRRVDQAKGKLQQARQSPSLERWSKTVASLETRVSGSRQRLPSKDELAQVLRGLSRVLNERGVRTPTVATAEAKRFGEFGVTPITVKFQGSFSDAHVVVQRIEKMPRLIQVDHFEVRRGEVTTQRPLDVHLKLSAFFSQKEPGS